MADSRTRVENTQDKPGVALQKILIKIHNHGVM